MLPTPWCAAVPQHHRRFMATSSREAPGRRWVPCRQRCRWSLGCTFARLLEALNHLGPLGDRGSVRPAGQPEPFPASIGYDQAK
jgi:hypothetical protein